MKLNGFSPTKVFNICYSSVSVKALGTWEYIPYITGMLPVRVQILSGTWTMYLKVNILGVSLGGATNLQF